MRVLYLTDRVSVRGGADKHLLQVMWWAVASNHRVTVATGRTGRGVPVPADVVVVRIRSLADRHCSTADREQLERLLSECDLVHVQNVMNPEVLEAATATGRAVVTVQDHRIFCPGPGKSLPDGSRCDRPMEERVCAVCLPDSQYRARMLEITSARRDAVRGATLVTLSRYMAAELEAEGLPEPHVIPPWVTAPPGEPVEGNAFLLAGRLVEHKAPGDAWAAWRRSGSGMALRVAGTGPAEDDLVGAERLGWLDAEDLARELRASRALLFPCRWQEPFGVLGIEALSQATPVIVSRSGGTAEWSGAGCLVVDPGDVGAMAEAIRTLADEPEVARELGRAGQAMVAERFAPSPITARLESLYRAVADGSGSARSAGRSVAAPPAWL